MRSAIASIGSAAVLALFLLLFTATASAAVSSEKSFEYLGCYLTTDILIAGKEPKSGGATNQPARCESLCDSENQPFYKYFALKAGCFCIQKDELDESKLVSMKKKECTEETALVYENLDPQQSSGPVPPTYDPVRPTDNPVRSTKPARPTEPVPPTQPVRPKPSAKPIPDPEPRFDCIQYLRRSSWTHRNSGGRVHYHGGRQSSRGGRQSHGRNGRHYR